MEGSETVKYMEDKVTVDHEKIFRTHFASRMFRDVADMDYISARTLFRNDCYDDFLVLAQQCVEKYLKGILLFNAVKHSKCTHRLMSLVDACQSQIPHFKLPNKAIDFIKKIDGFDDLRYAKYLFGGFSAERNHLIALDYTVMYLRLYCIADKVLAQKLSLADEDKIVMITKRGGVSFLNLLEKIQKGKDSKYQKLRSNLIWKNLYFSPRVKIVNFRHGWWAKGSGFNPDELRKAYYALRDYIFIPKDVKEYFEGGKNN